MRSQTNNVFRLIYHSLASFSQAHWPIAILFSFVKIEVMESPLLIDLWSRIIKAFYRNVGEKACSELSVHFIGNRHFYSSSSIELSVLTLEISLLIDE